MAARQFVQRLTLATSVLLGVAVRASALQEAPSYSALFDAADLVVIGIPVDRREVNEHAFLRIPSASQGGDSIPVIAVEARFRVVLDLKGTSSRDTTVSLLYHLHREEPAVVKIGTATMQVHQKRADPSSVHIGNQCGSFFDVLIDSPVDFEPGAQVQYLMFLRRVDGGRYMVMRTACPGECIQALRGRRSHLER